MSAAPTTDVSRRIVVPGVPAVPASPGVTRVLDDVLAFAFRFIAYPSPEAAVAHALWIVHTHAVECFENTPRIAFLSPEPGSGKSRAMEVTELLVPRAVLTVNVSAAYVFRKISDPAGLPTLLIDECDAIFKGSKSDSSEDLRGLLNSGYRRGATAGRAEVTDKGVGVKDWPSFSPVALAGLNRLPDTIMTRSVIIPMKRRKPDQRVEPFRRRAHGAEAEQLNAEIATWTESVASLLADAWPDMPPGVEDRDQDVWEPLIAVADAAGGRWPSLAREVAIKMVTDSKHRPLSLGVQLLSDIRRVLTEDRIQTGDLLNRLHQLETAPWASLKGEPIDAMFLARMLREYEIEPLQLRIGGLKTRGYLRADFEDAWERYTRVTPGEAGTAGTAGTPGEIGGAA